MRARVWVACAWWRPILPSPNGWGYTYLMAAGAGSASAAVPAAPALGRVSKAKAKPLADFTSWLEASEKTETAKVAEMPAGRPLGTAPGGDSKSDKWWDIPEQKLTRETKRDLQIIAARNYLDPKRFYKVRGTCVCGGGGSEAAGPPVGSKGRWGRGPC